VPGGFGGFRCVLGQVPGDHAIGDRAAGAQVDGSDVELGAPGDEPPGRHDRMRRRHEHRVRGGVLDRVDQVI
jgi:hypothetical protein